MKLAIQKREKKLKSELTQIRNRGDIPAVIYSKTHSPENVVVNGSEFDAAMRQIEQGHLPTTVFELSMGGKTHKAVVKEIQYHPTTYKVTHLDFLFLEEKHPIRVNVPVICTRVPDCVGIKLGGFLRQVTRHVPVRCLSNKIPPQIEIDVSQLQINDAIRGKDITFTDGVECLFPKNEVVIVIAKA